MSVRLKTILVVITIMLISVGGLYLASRTIILRSFEQAEYSLAQQELKQIVSLFSQDREKLTQFAREWSTNPDILNFVTQQKTEDLKANIRQWISATEIDFFGIYDASGNQLLSVKTSPVIGEWEEPPDFLNTSDFESGIKAELTRSCQSGLFNRPEGIYMFSSCLVPRANSEQKAGFLILARNLPEKELMRLRNLSGEDIQFIPLAEMTPALQSAFSDADPQNDELISFLDANSMVGFVPVRDGQGNCIGALRWASSRKLYQQGLAGLNFLLLAFALLNITLMLLGLFAVDRLITRPVTRLVAELRNKPQDELLNQVDIPGHPDAATLSRPLYTLLEQTREIQQKALLRSRLYLTLLEHAQVAVALLDSETYTVLDANETFYSWIGLNKTGESDTNFLKLITGNGCITGLDNFEQRVSGLKENQVITFEISCQKTEGERRDFLATVGRLSFNQHSFIYVTFNDISEIKNLQRELELQRDFALQVMNKMGQGLTITHLDGSFEFINPAFGNLLGYDPEQLLNSTFSDIICPEDLGKFSQALRKLSQGKFTQDEIRLLRKDGQVALTLMVGAPLVRTENVTAAIFVITDITTRSKVEETLRRNEEFLRALYNITSQENLPFSQKMQSLLQMGCQHFHMQIGVLTKIEDKKHTVLEKYISTLQQPTDQFDETTEALYQITLHANQLVAYEDARQIEQVLHNKDSQIKSYIGIPLIVNGNPYGILGFLGVESQPRFTSSEQESLRLMARWVSSVIEQEQYLNQLHAYSQEIMRANKELAIARDQALENSRLKSEFLATMSHEIRTPLNAVIGMAELLLETPLSPEQREYSEIVRESAQVLLTLINDILDFSKIEAGKLELEEIDFEPLQVIEGAVEIFTAKAREKNLSLMAEISPEIPPILCGDPVRLKQVLINLIGNAVKFTDTGEVLVRAEIKEQTVEDLLLYVEVKDTGIGLSASARERLFQPFTQADGSTTRQYGGTGLGLAISKRIVEMMGGEIGVESTEGKGSTFWFTARLGRSQLPISSAPILSQELAGIHALIVDNNQNHRLILRRYMQSWGMICEEAQDAQSALKILNSSLKEGTVYDVAIIDLQLPDMDGFSLADEIQSSEIGPALVALTAFDQRGLEAMTLRHGFAAFLTKPVKRGVLFQSLCSAVFGKPVAPRAPKEETSLLSENVIIETRAKQTSAPANRKLVLLAEDNLANQKLAVIQLEKLGFQVETVENGQKAIQAYLQAPYKYALILMDCQMPEMDGFTATRLIRDEEMKRGLHIPIVAMTANAMQGDREACIAAGMDDYISKPVTLTSLSEAIQRWTKTKEPLMPAPVKTSQPIEETEPLDPHILASIRELQTEDETDFLTELIDIYLADSLALMERIRHGLIEGDLQDARKALHSLKGTSANLGVRTVAAACNELESLLNRDDLNAALDWLPKLDGQYQRACEALRAERRP